jgi:nucleoside-diphosphate-sugar epimerase
VYEFAPARTRVAWERTPTSGLTKDRTLFLHNDESGVSATDRQRRFLITGGAGFIGSHLSEALLEMGHEVDILDNLSTGRLENIEHMIGRPGFTHTVDDVLNYTIVEDLVSRCDAVFHLAAAVGVKLIMEKPVETIITNVRGTEIVLELASLYGRKVLVASTSEVYGKAMEVNGAVDSLSETDNWTLGPTNKRRWAYACSKAMDEFLALAYYDEKKLPVVVTRFFNTVGPRQMGQYGMVVPRLVQRALLNEPLIVHDDGEQSRSFTHVNDAVRALILLMSCEDAEGEVVNIGNGAEITINALAARVIEMTGSESKIEHVAHEKIYGKGFEDMRRRTPNIDKLRELVGFEPRHDIDDILRDVISYYHHRHGHGERKESLKALQAEMALVS